MGGDGVFVFLLEVRSFLIWALTSLSFELAVRQSVSGFDSQRNDNTHLFQWP